MRNLYKFTSVIKVLKSEILIKNHNQRVYFFLFLIFFFQIAVAQNERYLTENFGPKEYGRNMDVQNWAVVQGSNGNMYFGNANGILEYDGRNWDFIPCVNGVYVTALAVGTDKLIYVGTQYGFGCLLPDITGKLHYYSLSDSIIENFFNTIVWKIHASGDHIYFQTEDAIFDYFNGKVSVILPENSFHLSFVINHELIVRERGIGLVKIKGSRKELIRGSEIFADKGVFSILSYPDNKEKLLIISQENGIWNYESGRFSQLKTPFDHVFHQSIIYGAVKLFDNKIALYTTANGILITDFSFSHLQLINTETCNLTVNDVKQIAGDRHGNIWAALNNGISKIYYSLPVTIYGKESGVSSNVYCINYFKGMLYAGASTGLFVRNKFNETKFDISPIVRTCVWALEKAGNQLIIGTNENCLAYDGQKFTTINNKSTRAICYVDETKMLFSGGKTGITLYRRNGINWEIIMQFEEISDEIIGLAYEKSGTGYRLWGGTSLNGVYLIEFNGTGKFRIQHFNENSMLPAGFCMPVRINDRVIFGTNQGLRLFPENTDTVSYKTGKFKQVPFFGIEIDKPVNTLAFLNNHLYVSLSDQVLYFRNGKFAGKPLSGIEAGKIRTIFFEDPLTVWFGCDDGLIQYRRDKIIPEVNKFHTRITSVFCAGDSALFLGNTNLRVDEPVLKYSENSLSFSFASDFYIFPEKTVYSFILEGIEKKWSPWSTYNKAAFIHLPEGKYCLRVKARNIYGFESTEAVYRFVIEPPWYRTRAAYAGYILFLIFFIIIIIRISNYRIRQKNIRLEKIVQERTAEIAAKNIVLQEQKEQIEKEKAKSENLLLNTLPAKVVEELKEKGYTEPESFENVTVYFSDIKGFTDMSSGLDPKYLISKLNEIFTAFDDIMSHYGCERIKTIGDAYMAVCGLPQTNENHAELMAKAAIDILKYLEERNKTDELPIKIRIGLNSGKVTGGIVGVRKYIYDVFGDTVNTASRMESNGEAMKINVSESTYMLLKDKFNFEERPPVEVKGKGVLKMYFLIY